MANKRETVSRAVKILADMTGQDLELKYQQFDGYQIQNKAGTYQPFGDKWMELGDIFLRVTFAITAMRMQQVNKDVTVVIQTAPNIGPITATYVFRGKLPEAEAIKIAKEKELALFADDKAHAAWLIENSDYAVEYAKLDGRVL